MEPTTTSPAMGPFMDFVHGRFFRSLSADVLSFAACLFLHASTRGHEFTHRLAGDTAHAVACLSLAAKVFEPMVLPDMEKLARMAGLQKEVLLAAEKHCLPLLLAVPLATTPVHILRIKQPRAPDSSEEALRAHVRRWIGTASWSPENYLNIARELHKVHWWGTSGIGIDAQTAKMVAYAREEGLREGQEFPTENAGLLDREDEKQMPSVVEGGVSDYF